MISPGAELLLDQALTVGIEMNGHRARVYPQELAAGKLWASMMDPHVDWLLYRLECALTTTLLVPISSDLDRIRQDFQQAGPLRVRGSHRGFELEAEGDDLFSQ